MKKERIFILAAGEGLRLGHLTADRPKCMVSLHGQPLLYWHLNTIKSVGIEDIVLIGGYKIDRLKDFGVRSIKNNEFQDTNMVYTLWCAEDLFEDSFIMAYGDIIYNSNVLQALLESPSDISVVVDRKWKEYWEERGEDILSDAESLKINIKGRIVSIGQKPDSINSIQGQYIGLVAFRGKGLQAARNLILQEKEENIRGHSVVVPDKTFQQLYMTDLLQGLINQGIEIMPVWTDGGWLEVDTPNDLQLAKRLSSIVDGNLKIER